MAKEQADIRSSSCSSNISELTDTLRENGDIVIQHFKMQFNVDPLYVIRVPGRVNLIGEHIDYCGFPVCPMALDKSIYVAVAPATDDSAFLEVRNVNSSKYPDSRIEQYKPKLDISLSKYGWISYIACGIQGVIDKNAELNMFTEPKKMLMAVHGNLPPGAGLSSSSALVCAAFLATCFINNITLSKTEMATLCSEAEHYIGTAGGGMDQAIAFNGQKGCAKLVKFNPLRLVNVVLPSQAVIIIANSLAEKNKAQSNDFNTRVVECRLAGQIIAKSAGIEDWRGLKKLSDVKNQLDGCSLNEMLILVDKVFHAKPYDKNEICGILGVTPAELNEISLTPDTYDVDCFKLQQRARHVFEEAERVYKWGNWCLEKKSLRELGSLMCKSHFSLQHLYECSHPDLDKLVSIFMMSGAYGARLTGAGWGGCTVALVSEKRIPDVMENLYNLYYKNIFEDKDDMSRAVFIVSPGEGAEVYNI